MGESSGRPAAGPVSIVVPAHDEEATIARLLGPLVGGAPPGELDVIVVCNGCHDRTAEVARSFGVRVVELAEPSKAAALVRGDAEANHFPRIYLDADIELTATSVRALADALEGAVLAAGPRREIPVDQTSLLVRAYYAVWTRLPQVQTGLFGRGVVAVSAAGWRFQIRGLQRPAACRKRPLTALPIGAAGSSHDRLSLLGSASSPKACTRCLAAY